MFRDLGSNEIPGGWSQAPGFLDFEDFGSWEWFRGLLLILS